MIILTRLNGPPFALNPDLIQRADITPDTVLTLVDGTKHLIAESAEEVIARIREYRASVVALSHVLEVQSTQPRTLQVVPDPGQEG
jgi:flagellar protein FlbD